MAAKTKKILITTERQERVVVRRLRDVQRIEFCQACGAESVFVELDAAAVSFAAAGQELIDGITSGRFHSHPSADGRLLICTRSMAPKTKYC